MTVAALPRVKEYLGDAVTLVFAVPFEFFAAADLEVALRDADGVETVQTLTTHYTVSGGNGSTGSVTFLAAPATGLTVVIRGDTDILQETEYVNGDTFPADSHERALDRLTMIAQERKDQIDGVSGRALLVPRGESGYVLLKKALRANLYPAFDLNGDLIYSQGTGADAGLRGDLGDDGGAGLVAHDPTVDYGAGTVGKRLNSLARRYVDVASYCNSNDALDAFAGIQAAFDDGYGREIVFTNPVGGTRYYRSLTRANGGLVMPRKGRIIFEGGTLLDFSDYADSGTAVPYLYAAGTTAAADLLAGDVAIGDRTISLGAGKGAAYARGDHAFLNSDKLFTTEDDTLGVQGEWIQIVSVAGDVLTLAGELRDSYATADAAKLTRYIDPCEISVENPQIIGAGKFAAGASGDRGIEIMGGVGCNIIGGNIKWSDRYGLILTNILNGKVDGVQFVKDENSAADPVAYSAALASGCENIEVANCDALHGREGFALTVSGSVLGVTRDITFRRNRARGMWRSGFASHDTHLNWVCERNIAEDCEQGFDCRIIDAAFVKNKVRRMGAFSGSLDCGFQIGSGGGKIRFEGNDYEDVLRGIWMPDSIVHEAVPGDITIKGEIMRAVRAHGVRLDYRLAPAGGANPSDPLGTVTVTDCDINCVTSVTSPRGVEIHGRWTKPVIARNTMRGGNANRCVYLHATSNAGTVGAIDPEIVDNEYDGGFTAPLVQHASGITKIDRNRGIGHWASGEVLRGSKTHDFGSIAGSFGAFESTTVTVVGAVVGDKATAWLALSGTTGIWCKAQVTAADTVTVHAINFSTSGQDPANGTLYVEVVKA